MWSGEVVTVHLIADRYKRYSYIKCVYFSEHSINKKNWFTMSNYATKSDLKEMRGISTSKLAKKV